VKSSVVWLSGERCRFWVHGHCLMAESWNPGWDARWRCRVLAALERTYDRALDAEEDGIAGSLDAWVRFGDAALIPPWDCEDFQMEDQGRSARCRFLRGSVCVLCLPPCGGRCPRFCR
jgi:hypothetical protein